MQKKNDANVTSGKTQRSGSNPHPTTKKPMFIPPGQSAQCGIREALHQVIMNISAGPIAAHVAEMSPLEAYRLGHRDARHDAAELVLSAFPELLRLTR
jgi:hypothetical protein